MMKKLHLGAALFRVDSTSIMHPPYRVTHWNFRPSLPYGLLAPVGTPAAIINKIQHDVVEVYSDP